jgi:esterase/lipase
MNQPAENGMNDRIKDASEITREQREFHAALTAAIEQMKLRQQAIAMAKEIAIETIRVHGQPDNVIDLAEAIYRFITVPAMERQQS